MSVAPANHHDTPMTEVETPCTWAGCIALCIVLSIGPLSILTGICCLIASLSTSHWLELYDNNGNLVTHGGLWEVCHLDDCVSWDESGLVNDTDYVKLSIAALIISCIAYLAGLLLIAAFVIEAMNGEKPSLGGQSSWGSALVFNLSGLGAFVKFQSTKPDLLVPSVLEEFDYGYSFHLVWICLVTVIVGCGITILIGFCCGGSPSTGDEDADVAVPAGNEVRSDVYKSESSAEPAGVELGFYRRMDP